MDQGSGIKMKRLLVLADVWFKCEHILFLYIKAIHTQMISVTDQSATLISTVFFFFFLHLLNLSRIDCLGISEISDICIEYSIYFYLGIYWLIRFGKRFVISIAFLKLIVPFETSLWYVRLNWKWFVRTTMSTRQINVWSWWRHQMKTFSALLAICVGNSPVPVNSRHKGQWRVALMFPFDLRLNKRWSKHMVRLVIWDAIAPIMTSP